MENSSENELLLSALLQDHSEAREDSSTIVRITGWSATGERIAKIRVTVTSLDTKPGYTATGHDVH